MSAAHLKAIQHGAAGRLFKEAHSAAHPRRRKHSSRNLQHYNRKRPWTRGCEWQLGGGLPPSTSIRSVRCAPVRCVIALAEVKAAPEHDDGCSFAINYIESPTRLSVVAGENSNSHHKTITKENMEIMIVQ